LSSGGPPGTSVDAWVSPGLRAARTCSHSPRKRARRRRCVCILARRGVRVCVRARGFGRVCFSARRRRGRARLGDATAIPVVRGNALAAVVVLSVSVAPAFVLGWVTRLCFLSCLATRSHLWSCSETWLCSLPSSGTRSRLCSCSAARRGRACGRARKDDVVAPAVVVALFDAVVLVVVVTLRESADLLVVLGDAVALVVVRDDGSRL